MKKILLTAFEPFGGETVNASEMATAQLTPPTGVQLVRLTVPTVFGRCFETVLTAVLHESPDAVVCIGQAAGRAAITPERTAVNLRDARIPDNTGCRPVSLPVIPDGPASFETTLPVNRIVESISALRIPARISDSAGTYVCNDLMYGLLCGLQRRGLSIPAGFIHVPCLPEQTRQGEASLPLPTIVEGLNAALEAIF